MAVRMKLVPTTWLEQTEFSGKAKNVSHSELANNSQNSTLLSPTFHARAVELMGKLVLNGGTVKPDGTIMYPDGSAGSNMQDLLKYVLYPKMLKIPRPSDSELFIKYTEATESKPEKYINIRKIEESKPWKSLF